ncbi:ribosome biogenesis GTPase Der [Leptospira jelokensis]|uniref:ribosome biogenesis GTPase Der n=1 Tax=Leptospira jelokensis TaxID=2484931 RepID=UPI001090C464|nr:ribosome biogenesis GTPase Der [Leptospira jelokensis]TGM00324.1 ribosome biogenesis GTPase Der [Leptospira jelokensis]
MKGLPVVTIVGRQNVGKSTLFNAILRAQSAITENTAGVTRDVLQKTVERAEFKIPFTLSDTPGLDIENIDEISKEIIEIAFEHLRHSDLILHVIDHKDLRKYDHKLIDLFKKDEVLKEKNVLTLINKVDTEQDEYDLEPFYKLGLNELLPISALGRRNFDLLYQKINFFLPDRIKTQEDPYCKIAIIGKPNSGKSSLLNTFLGYKRAVVSDVPGTTRDSVSDQFYFQNHKLEIIDTAGIRRKSKTGESLEFYSYKRTLHSLGEADVVVLLVDAMKGLGEFDKKIFGEIQELGKPMIVAVNKWDLVPEKESNSWKDYKDRMEAKLSILKERPLLSLSAKEKLRTHKLLESVVSLFEKSQKKLTTRQLNDWLSKWGGKNKVQKASNRPPKVFYATQVSQIPFKILFFVNDTKLFPSNILSFYRKSIVKEFGLDGLAVEIELRNRNEGKEGRE